MTAKRTARPQFQLLPGDRKVHDVADAGRRAAFEFLRGACSGWSNRELSEWLSVAYGPAVAFAPEGMAGQQRKTLVASGQRECVERTLLLAREAISENLALCSGSFDDAQWARDLVLAGFVTGARDSLGTLGYVAVDAPEMDIAWRVMALIAADYLTRPVDYRSLVICAECDEHSFSFAETHHRVCERAAEILESGVAPKNEAPAPDADAADVWDCA